MYRVLVWPKHDNYRQPSRGTSLSIVNKSQVPSKMNVISIEEEAMRS